MDCSGLGLALNLREFPLTALCAVAGKKNYFAGLYRFVHSLHKLSLYIFEHPIPPASCRYATFISARIVPARVSREVA